MSLKMPPCSTHHFWCSRLDYLVAVILDDHVIGEGLVCDIVDLKIDKPAAYLGVAYGESNLISTRCGIGWGDKGAAEIAKDIVVTIAALNRVAAE